MTNMKKFKTIAFAVAATMLAAAVLSPMAAAQSSTLTFGSASPTYSQGDSNALVPDTGRADIEFEWTYSIPQPGFGSVGAVQSQTLLTFSSTSCEDSNLKVSGARSIPVSLAEDGRPSDGDTGTAIFTVTASQQAPGETPITCSFTGKVQGVANQVDPSNDDTASTEVVVRYLGLISATIPTTIKQAGPQKQIKYDVTVSNLGNSISNIRYQLRDAEAAQSGGWNPVVPTPVVLQSESQGGTDTQQTVSFLVSTPFKNGWNNKEKTFTLDVTPESTKNPDLKGATVTMNVLARVRGVYVPSIEPMIMAGAVLGSALVARMMRDDGDDE